jgi:zinc D-Ala-D-Ala carboxypeptidase
MARRVNIKLSKYFTEKEMRCKCNKCMHTCAMSEHFLEMLDVLREESNGPLMVNSGFRCNSHNKAVGGVVNSFHTRGLAADVVPMGQNSLSIKELELVAKKYFKEVIPYTQFLHVADPF